MSCDFQHRATPGACIICREVISESSCVVTCWHCHGSDHQHCVFNSETTLNPHLSYICRPCIAVNTANRLLLWPVESLARGSRIAQRLRMWPIASLVGRNSRPECRREIPATPENEIVKFLLEAKCNPWSLDNSLEFPLHKAIRANNIEVVKTFLSICPENLINVRLYQNKTFLHLAAEHGSLEVVKLLVEEGANIDSQDCIKQTPIFLAASCGNVPIMAYLYEKGADLSARTFDQRTLLHRTVWQQHFGATKWLLDNGFNPNKTDRENWTPLHSAAVIGNVEIASLLLEYGASIDLCGKAGKNPLHIAEINKKYKMVEFLRSKYENSHL